MTSSETGRSFSARDHYEIDPDRELLGLGGANLAAGLSGGMVVNGSLSKTAVNDFIAATAAMLGVLVFDTLLGLFVAIGDRRHVGALRRRAADHRPEPP